MTTFLISGKVSGVSVSEYLNISVSSVREDTLRENQILYNGREWKNLFYMVKGDQFLFSKEFLPGTLIIRGKTFTKVSILFDIFKDEILIPNPRGGILQINKEMVDSFSIFFQNKRYHFARIPEDNLINYANVLYKGKSALFVRYNKKIEKLAVEGKYDEFYQESHTYCVKNSIVYPINSKKDLMRIFVEDKVILREFMKKNHLKISAKNPESFVPVIRYADSIKH
jgi:hypothetical protein